MLLLWLFFHSYKSLSLSSCEGEKVSFVIKRLQEFFISKTGINLFLHHIVFTLFIWNDYSPLLDYLEGIYYFFCNKLKIWVMWWVEIHPKKKNSKHCKYIKISQFKISHLHLHRFLTSRLSFDQIPFFSSHKCCFLCTLYYIHFFFMLGNFPFLAFNNSQLLYSPSLPLCSSSELT